MQAGLSHALVQRLCDTGDLGYEIYVDVLEQQALWRALWDVRQDLARGLLGCGQ